VPKSNISKSLKKSVADRANHCCEYCKLPQSFSGNSFAVDHITPESKGGETILVNLAYCCSSCNSSKYNKIEGLDELTNQRANLFNPRKQSWESHFIWNKDYSKILGISPIGRATVNALKMNLSEMENLRRALHFYGVFPPK